MQNLKKNWLVISNMTWQILWIFTQPLKNQKISLRWAICFQSIWGLSYKNTDELSFMALNIDAKIAWEVGWTFVRVLKSLKNFTPMGSFCQKHIMFQLTLKGDAKFKGKLTCGLKNNIRNLVNFHASSWKSKNLQFDWILLSKAYKDLDEKIQKSYVLWHWKVMQSLKKNWLVVSNTTWGI